MEKIDLLILTNCWEADGLHKGLRYSGIHSLDCKKAIILADFWSEAEEQRESYIRFITDNGIDFIFTYFQKPFYLWKDLEIRNRLIWFPVCFDPQIFNDWSQKKEWDVGNLNAGIFQNNSFYPERYAIHQKILHLDGIRYLYAKHPGTGILPADTPLVGKNFSMAINQCRLFVTTGSLRYRNFAPKYIEIMASKSCLFANEPLDADRIGLADGYNYVKIDETNVISKIEYYLEHEKEAEAIAENGYHFAIKNFSCYQQAAFVYGQLMHHPRWREP